MLEQEDSPLLIVTLPPTGRVESTRQQVAAQYSVIKRKCATVVNMLLLAQTLAEGHGSLLIYVPDQKDFLAVPKPCLQICVCVYVCVFTAQVAVYFLRPISKRPGELKRRTDPERMSRAWQFEGIKGASFSFCLRVTFCSDDVS